jgi:hypothetical protein
VTQAQVTKLQAELDQLRNAARGGFLENANTWGRSASAPAQIAPASAPAAGAVDAPALAPGPPGPAAALPTSSWGSGILGSIATTAAGVVAGSFLFQGIQGLMGHRNSGTGIADNAGTKTSEPAAATATQLPAESAGSGPGYSGADAAPDSADYAALDGADLDSGDSV